jgi:hypothetical protein
VTYDGTQEALHKHVVAILAGRETIITARMPRALGATGGARLWRLEAGRR